MALYIDPRISREGRHDVTEVLIAFAPPMHSKRVLRGTVLILYASLSGIDKVTGTRELDGSTLTGMLTTHPSISVKIVLTEAPDFTDTQDSDEEDDFTATPESYVIDRIQLEHVGE
jgi:hypothetical protein